MIGARREFLDPIEMADYNGNLVKVLAITGAFRKMQQELDKVIDQVKPARRAQDLASPEGRHDRRQGRRWRVQQPYALAKARAAYEIAQSVAGVNVRAAS